MYINRCKDCGNLHPGQPCATNPTKFIWRYGGDRVYIRGSWSRYQGQNELIRQKEYPFWHTVTIDLQVGVYTYKYVIGNEWRHDPSEDVEQDTYGGYNNIVLPLRVSLLEQDDYSDEDFINQNKEFQYQQQNGTICRFKTYMDEQGIELMGSWDDWQGSIKMERKYLPFSEIWERYATLKLIPGVYQYKFRIGDKYIHDNGLPCIHNTWGTYNNLISVGEKRRSGKNYNKHTGRIKYVKWSSIPLVRTSFDKIHGHSMTKVGDEVFIFGGVNTGTFTSNMLEININDMQLRILEDISGDIPKERAFHSCTQYGNKIIYYSGLNATSILNDLFIFNASTHAYNNYISQNIPSQREHFSFTGYTREEVLILFGGYYCSSCMEIEEIYNDVYCMCLRYIKWKKLKFQLEQPSPRYSHTATQIGGQMYVFGGQTNNALLSNKNFNDLWVLDLTKNQIEWSKVEPNGIPPEPRHGHSAVYHHKKIFIFGGQAQKRKKLNDVWFYDRIANEWVRPQVQGEPPIPRFYHASISVNDEQMWILGGNLGLQKNQNLHILTVFEESDINDTNEESKNNQQIL